MARKSPIAESFDDASARSTPEVAPDHPLFAFTPIVATWCESSARMIALVQQAELARAAALSTLAKAMSAARNTDDLATLANRLHQAWMELGSARQADIAQVWAAMQDEVARQLQSLSELGTSSKAGQAESGSPVAALIDQAQASLAQWTRNWAAIARTPEAVQ